MLEFVKKFKEGVFNENYEQTIRAEKNIIELLAVPDNIDFEPATLDKKLYNPANLE